MHGRDQPKLQCKNISSPQKLFVKIANLHISSLDHWYNHSLLP